MRVITTMEKGSIQPSRSSRLRKESRSLSSLPTRWQSVPKPQENRGLLLLNAPLNLTPGRDWSLLGPSKPLISLLPARIRGTSDSSQNNQIEQPIKAQRGLCCGAVEPVPRTTASTKTWSTSELTSTFRDKQLSDVYFLLGSSCSS
jgi:hypothetical protein